MARPIKNGLSYFPLDVDADYADKIQLIEGLYGPIGFATVIKLYMKIYSSGYYYPWEEKEQILLAKRVGIEVNTLNNIVLDCIKYELFHEKLFSEYKILTSEGIQNRFFIAVGKRKRGVVYREYLLINERELKDMCPSMTIESIIQGKTEVIQEITPVIQESGTQSKVNKIKEKKRKIKGATSNQDSIEECFQEIWKLYPKKTMRKEALAVFNKEMGKGTDPDIIKKGIENYLRDLKANPWKKPMDGGRWFQKERWEDEYQTSPYQKPEDDKEIMRIEEIAKARADSYLDKPVDERELPF
ncbi:DUF4373 domain-containing protein [Trichococcus sp. K1Tr]|uniref:DUF4373 domain-containing protein n=1 Tax=Trichococcus sp. K1Tr TaxID=3020847 RepID=UPI00232AF25C|nr:DUF4373 domain-containing protein [Trichococcus sp. K1Tr]MDB6353641.1 DUF4373 domain-containing protein [Trichococcus sp. K1Tr]